MILKCCLFALSFFFSFISVSYPLHLLDEVIVVDELEPPAEIYNRKKHFGTWIRAQGCLNVRHLVLLTSSLTEDVSYTDDRNCRVKTGLWFDFFSGLWFEKASEVDIDHMIPLKHAYDRGAHRWGPARRCYFANFIDHPHALVPMDRFENRIKGDQGPTTYTPTNPEARCHFVRQWVEIKAIWDLEFLPDEIESLEQARRNHGCSEDLFWTEDWYLWGYKEITYQTPEFCPQDSNMASI